MYVPVVLDWSLQNLHCWFQTQMDFPVHQKRILRCPLDQYFAQMDFGHQKGYHHLRNNNS